MDAIKTADEENAEAERVREKEKADFETELADYKDSIAALNQATLPATFKPRLAEHFRSERCKTS